MEQRREGVIARLSGLPLLGEIITWDTPAGTYPLSVVQTALTRAGLDRALVRDLGHELAFHRATEQLEEGWLVHVVSREPEVTRFQFTSKHVVDKPDDKELAYQREARVDLCRMTGRVFSREPVIKTRVEAALDKVRNQRTGGDISSLVQRLFEQHSELWSIRERGGAYFVPREYTPFTIKVDTFLRVLGGKVNRFPIPEGTEEGDKAVADAVADGLQRVIDEHLEAVSAWSGSTRNATMEDMATKINATRIKVEAYAGYLKERQDEILAAVEAAKEFLRAKVDSMGKEQLLHPEVSNRDRFGCRLDKSTSKINACLATDRVKTAEEISISCGVPVAKVRQHLNYWSKLNVGIVKEGDGWRATPLPEEELDHGQDRSGEDRAADQRGPEGTDGDPF